MPWKLLEKAVATPAGASNIESVYSEGSVALDEALLQATCLVAGELFRDASFSASALRQDRSGHVRAQLVQCVFSAAANHAEVCRYCT